VEFTWDFAVRAHRKSWAHFNLKASIGVHGERLGLPDRAMGVGVTDPQLRMGESSLWILAT
jgi:hypothetical protein